MLFDLSIVDIQGALVFGMNVLLQICCIFSEYLSTRTHVEGCFWYFHKNEPSLELLTYCNYLWMFDSTKMFTNQCVTNAYTKKGHSFFNLKMKNEKKISCTQTIPCTIRLPYCVLVLMTEFWFFIIFMVG